MYREFVKIHFAEAYAWCSIKQTFHLYKLFFIWQEIKPLMAVDIGTWAKLCMADSKLFCEETSMQLRWQCLKFYQVAAQYLLHNLPLNKPLISHAPLLHHNKRNNARSMSAISNLGAAVTKVCHFSYANGKTLFRAYRSHYLLTFSSILIFYRWTRIILILETEWVNDDNFIILICLGRYI